MDVSTEPRHLASISLRGPEHISAAAFSPDATSVAVSQLEPGSLRLFKLSSQEV